MSLKPRRRYSFLALTAALGYITAGMGAGLAQEQEPAEMVFQAKAVAMACRNDLNWLCPDVKPGGGRLLACLESNAGELTAKCREALPMAKALKAKASEAGVLPQ